jgi:uncharacterized protein YhhL (DUF1145 family)
MHTGPCNWDYQSAILEAHAVAILNLVHPFASPFLLVMQPICTGCTGW